MLGIRSRGGKMEGADESTSYSGTPVTQIFDDFLGYFEKDYFYVKSSTNTFWGNFWK